jgi:hypothetical protein
VNATNGGIVGAAFHLLQLRCPTTKLEAWCIICCIMTLRFFKRAVAEGGARCRTGLSLASAIGCVLLLWAVLVAPARATPDQRFDVVTFCCPCSVDSHICQTQFDHLNFPTTNGHYIAMGTDAHRLELAINGNPLAIYYNTFNDGYPTNSGAQQAALIDQYAVSGFTSTGPKPDWIVLNEISSGLWQSDATYRAWAGAVVHALKNTYGYNVILYAPFANPGANASDWQAIAADAYIGIENYLSGSAVKANGFSISWCQSQYQSSIASYTGLGVSRAKLMLGEEFPQTTTGTQYGRSGVSSNDWDTVIVVRTQAAQNVGFAGFLSYAWSGNAMLVPDDELIHYEDTYRTNQLPVNSGITAPFILFQPQDQTTPSGGNVAFTVFRAGTAPMTFQWRFNGTNLSGATASSLSLTNVQVSDAGNYSVVLNDFAGTLTSSNAFLTVAVPNPLAFDPFVPAVTAYAPGANLVGQTNAGGGYWTQAGPSGSQPAIQAGSLSVGGLSGLSGNSVKFGGNGMSARFNLGTNTASGTWFYSFIVRFADITGLSSSGVFWAGFNNSSGTQTTPPTSVGTRVVTRSATGGFNLGLDKSSGSPASFVFSPLVFTPNDVIFLVGSYTFNSGSTNDDVSQLWINPAASTFGLATAPPAALTNNAGTDLSGIASFVLFNRNSAEPALVIADEVRVGASWASVTPPAEIQAAPVLNLTRAGNTSVLSWTTNAPGFLLEATPALSNSNAWARVIAPVYLIVDQFVVTNNAASGNFFYRLRKP